MSQHSLTTFELVKTYVKYSLIGWLIFSLVMSWALYAISDIETTIVRASSFLVPMILLFYSNLLWLSPKYLSPKKKKTYFLLIAALIVSHAVVFGALDLYVDKILRWDLPHIHERPLFMVYFGRTMSTLPPLIVSALIWKSLLLQKQKQESFELKNRMLQAETKALKAQINPHFLFNSMNNIYSLSQMKSDKTGDAILNLSEILRFVTYESEKDRVSLQEELKQIRNFIALQFLKDDNQDNVKIEITEVPANLQIAPMMLLPFIENSFKHSNFEDKVNGWIDIKISVEEQKMILSLSNSGSLTSSRKDETGGVGMENVKKRLSLIYPEKHHLVIKQDTDKYSVNLELDLS